MNKLYYAKGDGKGGLEKGEQITNLKTLILWDFVFIGDELAQVSGFDDNENPLFASEETRFRNAVEECAHMYPDHWKSLQESYEKLEKIKNFHVGKVLKKNPNANPHIVKQIVNELYDKQCYSIDVVEFIALANKFIKNWWKTPRKPTS